MFVYIPKNGQFSVGFYIPTSGIWVEESVKSTADAAAARVSYLNGGSVPS